MLHIVLDGFRGLFWTFFFRGVHFFLSLGSQPMIPQYFPWLWDDRSAWEQALSDARYSYDLPLDAMMSLYEERRVPALAATGGYALSMPAALPGPAAPPPLPPAFQTGASPLASFAAPSPLSAPLEPSAPAEESDDGILSQAEIDALLAGT
jgi:hypothetical protein